MELVRRGDADGHERVAQIEREGYNRRLMIEQAEAAATEIRAGAKRGR
jgi:hypothetical protein